MNFPCLKEFYRQNTTEQSRLKKNFYFGLKRLAVLKYTHSKTEIKTYFIFFKI